MARRTVRRSAVGRKRTKRRRTTASGTSSALARARTRIDELEAENRRLRRELAAARGEPTDDLGGDGNDAPLAPGM
jgi:outer membrane protein TolC